MPEALRLLLAGVVGAAVALAAQHWLQPKQGSPAPLRGNEQASSEGALAIKVANLELSQQRLRDELTALRSAERSSPAAAESLTSSGPPAAEDSPRPSRPASSPNIATVAGLVESGFSDADAQSLVARLDELALARLDANFQLRAAVDETDRVRLNEQRRQIPRDQDAIREEFGDAAFDQYLYSVGQPNRVAVSSVLRDSAAQVAGLQSGDFLRSLDGEALYSARDLTNKIRAGSQGTTYSLIVERNGELIETFVPGGPLGVRVAPDSAQPEG